ncbi:alpha/beta hydrolase [Parvularcula marina]|uniref:Alpha/beta hydrolase n=1 Tax=Parvularcula marina TaxID=2292771 RepID=A0A371RGB2_9PROT|nr:alpha/beta hydrolase-fold protein [Parvularcula marina]RFB04471.1 alpha/beta hydrolase [Parvularcula marina]
MREFQGMNIRRGAAALLAGAAMLAGVSAMAEPAAMAPVVIGESMTLPEADGYPARVISVHLPPSYAEGEEAYPVVYMLDGGPEQDFPHIAGIAQSNDINYTMSPFILVGVQSINRRHELSPVASDPDTYEEYFGARPGGSAEFRRELEERIKPWVEETYRTSGHDVLIGESLAALFIIETVMKTPDLFDDYAAISPSLWWDEARLGHEARAVFADYPAGERRLYLTMGNEGYLMQEGLDMVIAALEAEAPAGLHWSYTDRRNTEHHGSIYHPAALDALRAFFTVPGRTGSPLPALYKDGVVPEMTAEARASLDEPCDAEHAEEVSFAKVNADPDFWQARCILTKPGPEPDKGKLPYGLPAGE